jgi:hypothetical protein
MFRSALLTAAVGWGLAPLATAAIVFDNTTSYTGLTNTLMQQGEMASTEHGNRITLAGGERIVSGFVFYLRVLGAGPCTFQYQVRFRRNDGPEGRPGTLLWDSGVRPAVIDSGAPLGYSVAVPGVVVPSSFTWTVEVSNRQLNMSPMGPAEYNPPSVGSAPFGYWRRMGPLPEDWAFIGLTEPPFGARVTASACAVPKDGDLNGDGRTDSLDIPHFASAALAGSTVVDDVCRADFDDSASVDAGDVDGMVGRLLGT